MQKEELKQIAEILDGIINSSISFHDANVQIQKKALNSERVRVDVAYIGAVLRNYVSLNALIDSYFSKIMKSLRSSLLIGLVTLRYSKDEKEKDEIKVLLEELFRRVGLENYLVSLKNLMSNVENSDKLIPKEYQPNTIQYFSCLYNIPSDLFKMWSKQYGIRTAIRTASSYSRRAPAVYRVNTNKILQGDLLAKNEQGLRASETTNVLNYNGKGSIRSSASHKEGLIFKTQKMVFDITQKMDVKNSDTLIYASDETCIPFEIMLSIQENEGKGLDIVVSRDSIKFPLMQKANAIRNVKQYVRTAPFEGLEAHLHKKYHNVVFIPASTKLDDVSARPELLIQLNLDVMDKLIQEQAAGLSALAQYVEEYGYIYYMIPTLSKKETTKIVHDFVNSNPDYKVVSETQYFPFEKGGATLYCAILKKETVSNGEN